ncbi:hypothetical protein [uncultured Pseudoteredinibacter sp.]|uniref:hypothetical protein n=1 Tax=uncultured Pseudoteredinibacter sp. TaxID=1641701 RepID=UPI00261C101D|nr:hypothetical protein [uncultured Pseudoteredinibacter sp.]
MRIKAIAFVLSMFAVLAAFLWFLQRDEALSEESLALLSKVDPSIDSPAYRFLMGFAAPKGESPLEEGTRLLLEIRKQEKDSGYAISYKEGGLPAIEGDLACKTWEDNCLNILFSGRFEIERLLEQYKTRLDRVKEFYQFYEYNTLSEPILSEPFAPYLQLMSADRLIHMQAIQLHQQGGSQAAIDALYDLLESQRKMLSLQDQLVGKITFLVSFRQTIDVLSVIASEATGEVALKAIKNFSAEERDFSRSAAREFNLMYNFALERVEQQRGWSSVWRVLYKPLMTVNEYATQCARFIKLAGLSPLDLKGALSDKRLEPSVFWKLHNMEGALEILVYPNFEKYVVLLNDIDSKILLFNGIYADGRSFTKIVNPYFPSEFAKLAGDKVCFDGIDESGNRVEGGGEKWSRCLLVRH